MWKFGLVACFLLNTLCLAQPWKNGPPADPEYFPIGVWAQQPRHAPTYKDLGINLYVALWAGPTQEQLDQLKAAGMQTICEQNELGLKQLDNPLIIGWLLPDEPDNAQPRMVNGKQEGWGPPVKPEEIVRLYKETKSRDPSRPVLLNLGQGVANDKWIGRGVEGKPEDYNTYVHGGDIVSFDIYPAAMMSDAPLHLVGEGVKRLRTLTEQKKPIWAFLECTSIDDAGRKPTPHQVRAEAWQAITKGATGLVYFVHCFVPSVDDAALLKDAEMMAAIKKLNAEITSLAPVINAGSPDDTIKVTADVPVSVMTRLHNGKRYAFVVTDSPAGGTVTIATPAKSIEAIGGGTLAVEGGNATDTIEGWGVRLYRIAG